MQQIAPTVLHSNIKLDIVLLISNQFDMILNKISFVNVTKWIKLKHGLL